MRTHVCSNAIFLFDYISIYISIVFTRKRTNRSKPTKKKIYTYKSYSHLFEKKKQKRLKYGHWISPYTFIYNLSAKKNFFFLCFPFLSLYEIYKFLQFNNMRIFQERIFPCVCIQIVFFKNYISKDPTTTNKNRKIVCHVMCPRLILLNNKFSK